MLKALLMNPFRNAARQKAIETDKRLNEIAEANYALSKTRIYLWFMFWGSLTAVLLVYRPQSAPQPAEKEPSIKRDTVVKHKRTPRCTWDPKDPCNERRNKK